MNWGNCSTLGGFLYYLWECAMIVKYDFSGFMPRQEKDKGELVVYLHRRATTGEPFYVGIGVVDRPKSVSDRNDYWTKIYNKHGRTIELLSENGSEVFVKKTEIWCIAIYRGLVGRKRMANISDGGEGNYGLTGEKSASFQGYLRLFNDDLKVQVVVAGRKDMVDNGFNYGNISSVKNGKLNSVGSKFYADENGFRIQFQVAGPFYNRVDAILDGYSFAEKNATDAKWNEVGKTLGTLNGQFKGFKFGINHKTKRIVMTVGRTDTKTQGFDQGDVDRNIRGNPKVKHVKGFVFNRINNQEELIILCSDYLEDGYEFHHELTEKNFLMLCDTSS